MSLLKGAIASSVIFDCGICWPYSLNILSVEKFVMIVKASSLQCNVVDCLVDIFFFILSSWRCVFQFSIFDFLVILATILKLYY